MTDNPSTPVVPVEPARQESDENLLSKLREPVDQGGYDGFSPDPLHISAANRIEGLLMALGTERTMHNAWRKRAEEAEAAALTPVPVVAAPPSARENCPTSRRTGQGDCGEMFTVHGVTHSCKYLADHEDSHWCNCKPATTTPSPVSREPISAERWLNENFPSQCEHSDHLPMQLGNGAYYVVGKDGKRWRISELLEAYAHSLTTPRDEVTREEK